MSHRVLGIDLGSWSVKIAEIELGFRATRALSFQQRRVSLDRPWPEGALEALALLRADQGLAAETRYVGWPGDRQLIHPIEIPFTDERKISSVLGYELESQIPWALDEVCFDYVTAGTPSQGAGSLILTATARRADVETLLADLRAMSLDPYAVVSSPFAYAALGEKGEVSAWIDVGHRVTNVCVLDGSRTRFARTISGAGHDVTQAIAKGLRLSYADAESLKHGGEFDARSAVIKDALHPLLRELRMTLAACAERTGIRPARVVLCGGSSELPGLAAEISSQLELPVDRAGVGDDRLGGPLDEAPPHATLSLAIALGGGRKGLLPNLRTGAMSYRGDASLLRAKFAPLAAMVVSVFALAILSGFASLASLKHERKQLEDKLASETQRLFGQEILDGNEVSRRLRGEQMQKGPPVPQKSAFELLQDLSARTPPNSEVRLDVQELELKPKKSFMKATTDSAAAVDRLVESWKQSECVSGIQKGKVADSAAGQEKQFSLTIETRCF